MRTIKPQFAASEAVVADALRTSLFDFLTQAPRGHQLNNTLAKHADPDRVPRWIARWLKAA